MTFVTNRLKRVQFLAFWLVIFMSLAPLAFKITKTYADEHESKNIISSIKATQQADIVEITIQGSLEPAYTIYELFNPARIVVDIANSTPANSLFFKSEAGLPITMSAANISDTEPALTRFEFTLPQSLPFQTSLQGKNITISIHSTQSESETASLKESPQVNGTATSITDISVSSSADETIVTISANGKISSFQHDVLDKDSSSPPRLYIDIDNIRGEELLPEQNIGTAVKKIRVAKHGDGLRIVFDSSSDTLFPYQIHESDNGIKISITEPAQQLDQITSLISQKQSIDEQLPQIHPVSEPTPISSKGEEESPLDSQTPDTASQDMKDKFSFAGYNKKRITVDFYKIDLHNVFRLLREISEQNIIVDEAVGGSLTLALNDVPWDFALDIILNIKNLQKEERFNTIVIFPKSKQFDWPNRAEDNLTFEAVEEIAAEEAIVIQQRQNLPQTVIEAKKLITEGKRLEKEGDYENAVNKYKEALTNWPQNSDLANKISSLFLVQLRQNSNAVHFAQKALEINNQDHKAALNAAIGLANMHKFSEAQDYFDQSVSNETPTREALLSYAVFSEENNRYDAAITLLQKHDRLLGENLDSMLAQARILDKQGNLEAATKKYTSILLSGFHIPPDLKQYINGRITLSQKAEP